MLLIVYLLFGMPVAYQVCSVDVMSVLCIGDWGVCASIC
jgi:hypothetical protein